MQPIPDDPAFVVRFRERIARTDDITDCFVWTGAPGQDGYGTWTWTGTNSERTKFRAHRLALTLDTPPPNPAMYALHTCNTPLCCNTNPGHLYWGTARDNAADRDHPHRRWQLRNRRIQQTGQLGLFVAAAGMFALPEPHLASE